MSRAQKSLTYLTGQPLTDSVQIGNEKIKGGISKNKVGKRTFLYIPNKFALIKAVRDLVFRNVRGLVITGGKYAFKKRNVQPFFSYMFSKGRSFATRVSLIKEKVDLLDAIIERMLTVSDKKTDVLQGSPVWCLQTASGYMCNIMTKNKDILSLPYISKALLKIPKNPDNTEL